VRTAVGEGIRSVVLVLDTSAVSRLMQAEAVALAHAGEHEPGDLFLTPVVAAEIQCGIARLRAGSRRAQLLRLQYRRWRALLVWLAWTEGASDIFGEQKARLEARGALIEDMDIAVAAIAMAHGFRVATCNARHFGRIEGLRVDDWAEARSG
jgi:tRNA(fMet)-specific endonuclease VapC